MVCSRGNSPLSQDQVKELQNAIQESTRKLVEAQQKRLRAEEEIIQW